jgi:predicted GNAT family acetyltransferase
MTDHCDSAIQVRHEPALQRFVIDKEGAQAVLDYRMSSPNVVDFNHTYSPTQFRGQGLAGKLVAAGVGWARAQNYRVVGSCSYVAAWLQREGNGRT